MDSKVRRFYAPDPFTEYANGRRGSVLCVEALAFYELLAEFERFVEVASSCDSWESFPSDELVRAYKVIDNAKGEYNEQ